ncbi:MAG TPA: FGGY family carbohydrate kinase [Candidatus Dormibacteraeota bacterium]|nr:FGGY family carbohydrate kinase [Candidatus Dormibacteraeota bacterium]
MPTSAAPTLLGLDVGSTRIKAALLDRAGRQRGVAAVATPFAQRDGGVEMGVDELLAAVAGALRALGPGLGAVAGVGVAGMAECGAPLDAAGHPLGPVIAWYDPRGEAVVERLRHRGGRALEERTGRRLRTVSSVAKLGWWVERSGRGPGGWLGVPELCVHALSGAAVTDPSLASRTGWYDVGAREYLPEVAAAIGVAVAALPAVVAAGSVAGRVTADASAWSGLAAGIPVTSAGHDHLAAAAGCVAGLGDLVDSVGTAESLVRRLPGGLGPATLRRALELGVAVSARPDGEGWALLGRGPRAGPVLAAVAAALGSPPLEELDAAAVAGAGPGAATGLVDAILAGAPGPEFPSRLTPGELWGAVLDELAARTAAGAALCERLAGPAERVLVAGGGARSLPWVRAKARRLAAPVLRADAAECAARGAAVAAGVAAGWWPDAGSAPPPGLEAVAPG